MVARSVAGREQIGIGTYQDTNYLIYTFTDEAGRLNLNGLHLYFKNLQGNSTQIINQTVPPFQLVPQSVTLVGGEIRFSFQSRVGQTYRVEYTDALATQDWHVLRTIVGDGTVLQITDPIGDQGRRFYRVALP